MWSLSLEWKFLKPLVCVFGEVVPDRSKFLRKRANKFPSAFCFRAKFVFDVLYRLTIQKKKSNRIVKLIHSTVRPESKTGRLFASWFRNSYFQTGRACSNFINGIYGCVLFFFLFRKSFFEAVNILCTESYVRLLWYNS